MIGKLHLSCRHKLNKPLRLRGFLCQWTGSRTASLHRSWKYYAQLTLLWCASSCGFFSISLELQESSILHKRKKKKRYLLVMYLCFCAAIKSLCTYIYFDPSAKHSSATDALFFIPLVAGVIFGHVGGCNKFKRYFLYGCTLHVSSKHTYFKKQRICGSFWFHQN